MFHFTHPIPSHRKVDFCHRKGKLLRDIKLSNVLLAISEGQLPLVKLCDFTISKDMLRDQDEPNPVRQGKGETKISRSRGPLP